MRFPQSVMCGWPGLPRLWCQGDVRALGMAIAFGAGLNGLLLASVQDVRLFPFPVHMVGWILLSGVWIGCAFRGYRELPRLRQSRQVDDRGLFIQAQGEYLRGHWFEAESLLQQLLKKSPEDADARLLLATMYRRTRRWEEARTHLVKLVDCEGALKWRTEIEAERRRVSKFENVPATASESSPDGERIDGDS